MCLKYNRVLNNGILVSGSLDKTIKLWNTHTGEVIKTLQGIFGITYAMFLSNQNKIGKYCFL